MLIPYRCRRSYGVFMLEALAMLATLAYFDMSLVLLRLAGALDLSKPVTLVLAGLFFRSRSRLLGCSNLCKA